MPEADEGVALLAHDAACGRRPFGPDGTVTDESRTVLFPSAIASGPEDDYEYDQQAEVRMLDLLFSDMGVPHRLARAARLWATRQIEYQKEMSCDAYTMGALQRDLWFWLGGYEQALVDLGLRDPDNRNTFHS
jgi:hypothetical protein